MWSELQDRHSIHSRAYCPDVHNCDHFDAVKMVLARTNDLVKLEARKLCGGKNYHTHSETQKSYSPTVLQPI